MKSLFWFLIVLAAVGLLLGYSWAEGQWTGRWNPSDASRLAAAKLKTVPLSIGDWEGQDAEFNESQLALGELDGYLHRIYLHRTTGERVQVLIVCGRAGPVSLHTPDVCYRGLGFLPTSLPEREALRASDDAGPDAYCWGADFEKTTPLGKETLRIGWTWLAGGRWQAVDQPRFEFATEPALFKAYFIHPLHQAGTSWDEDSIPKLAKDLLPLLTEHLVQSAKAPAEEQAIPTPQVAE